MARVAGHQPWHHGAVGGGLQRAIAHRGEHHRQPRAQIRARRRDDRERVHAGPLIGRGPAQRDLIRACELERRLPRRPGRPWCGILLQNRLYHPGSGRLWQALPRRRRIVGPRCAADQRDRDRRQRRGRAPRAT